MRICSNVPQMIPCPTPSFLNMKENSSRANTKLGHLRQRERILERLDGAAVGGRRPFGIRILGGESGGA